MKIGAVFPTTEIGEDPVAIRDFAQTAEELGYAHLLTYDHVLGAEHADREPRLMGPYNEDHPFHEPFVLFGFLAAATSRIELATGVLILPQRQTALVAKQAAELELLSGGRLRLGLGTGWNWVEYESLGTDFATRGKRFDEQVEVLRRLWREPLLDYEGRFHRVARAGILPRPRREIPVWFGGFTPAALRRAARSGDGFIFGAFGEPIRKMLGGLRERVREQGRDPATFGAEALIDYSAGPEVWNAELEAWRDAGGTHLSMRAMDTGAAFLRAKPAGLKTPRDHIGALETFMKAIT
jgi:probable F420-dependent oxidoreductase